MKMRKEKKVIKRLKEKYETTKKNRLEKKK